MLFVDNDLHTESANKPLTICFRFFKHFEPSQSYRFVHIQRTAPSKQKNCFLQKETCSDLEYIQYSILSVQHLTKAVNLIRNSASGAARGLSHQREVQCYAMVLFHSVVQYIEYGYFERAVTWILSKSCRHRERCTLISFEKFSSLFYLIDVYFSLGFYLPTSFPLIYTLSF